MTSLKSTMDCNLASATGSENPGKPGIVVICGPTAIGKTSVAISVAESFAGEIVGADSMQIYRKMDIGTAKPTAEERFRIHHHMIDVAEPDEPFDAARFYREARASVFEILRRGRLPVVAGGTGFYIKALLHGLCDAAPDDPLIRQRLRDEAARRGEAYLYDRLRECDPSAAGKIHPNDIYRILRALEVFDATGLSMTEFRQRHSFSDAPFEALKIGLDLDRQVLYDRINRRVEQMIAEGLLEEVKSLLGQGLSEDLRPMQSLGYRHMIDFLKGRLSWDSAVETLKRDTRRYAKRQLTWFRADPEIFWRNPAGKEEIHSLVRRFVSRNCTGSRS